MNIPGYTIERRIGTGGQAMVYEAVQDSLQRRVALKVLNPVLSGNKEFTERFLNEGRILANLHHSNVITIHDIGVVDDLHYLSMELVQGGDLRRRMRQGLAPETVIDYVAIIADCLGTAHDQQVVHRDIKPGNVLFRQDGTLLLTDFGIAKLLDAGKALTLTGTTLGSPSYLSPEQAQNLPLDGRADIYSLGAMAFEMLSGRKPYAGDSEFATIHCHLTAPIPRLSEALADYQPLIERMMAKSPDDRFANAAELIEALRALRPEIPVRPRVPPAEDMIVLDSGEPTPATLPLSGSEPTLPEGAEAAEATTRVNPTAPRRRRRAQGRGLAVAAGVVLGVAAGWAYLGHLRADRAPSGGDAQETAAVPASVPSTVTPASGAEQPATGIVLDGSRAPGAPEGGPLAAAPAAEGSSPAETPTEAPAESTTEAPAETLAAAAAAPVPAPETVTEQTAPTPTPTPTATPASATDAERVAALLASAREAMDELRLTRPEDRSALFYYDQVLIIEPDNREALDGHRVIAERYAGLAESALARGDTARARALIGRGLSVDDENARLLALSGEIESKPAAQRRASANQATATAGNGEIQGETPEQLYRRIKSWFN